MNYFVPLERLFHWYTVDSDCDYFILGVLCLCFGVLCVIDISLSNHSEMISNKPNILIWLPSILQISILTDIHRNKHWVVVAAVTELYKALLIRFFPVSKWQCQLTWSHILHIMMCLTKWWTSRSSLLVKDWAFWGCPFHTITSYQWPCLLWNVPNRRFGSIP